MVTEDLKRSTETPVQETGKCFGSQRSRCRVENLKTCVLEKQVKIPPQCFSTASVEEEKTPVFEKRSFSPSRVANSHLFIKEISFVICGQANFRGKQEIKMRIDFSVQLLQQIKLHPPVLVAIAVQRDFLNVE